MTVSRHHTYEQGEIETLLVSGTDAQSLAEAVMERRKYIRPTVKRALLTQPNFNVMDFVTTTVKRKNGSVIIPEAVYEVIGVDKLTGEITLKWVKGA